jgi:CheY-like chemotaxis protein
MSAVKAQLRLAAFVSIAQCATSGCWVRDGENCVCAAIQEVPDWRMPVFSPGGADMPRVLVVDDDPMVCMAIEIYLERHSFQVTIADGGEAGLRALEGTTFDLMIVDIFMPHMRGFESIRIFHERAPMLPLIAMSGYAFANLDSPAPDFLRMALELGATRCLRKPFTPVALLAVINECMAESQSRVASTVQLR